MRTILFLSIGALLALSTTSCIQTLYTKNMTYIPIILDTIPARPSGDYTAEATLKFKQNIMVTQEQAKEYKQLAFSKKVNYGALNNGASAVNPIGINTNQGTLLGRWQAKRAKKGSLRASARLAVDPTYDKALYSLVEANPTVDYWTNIRIERTVQGRRSAMLAFKKYVLAPLAPRIYGKYSDMSIFIKTGDETVKVIATGVDIMSDAELEEYNKSRKN